MKEKLQKFFEKFTIKKKIVIACIPFLLISYIILFLSVTLIMYYQMKNMVFEQTKQNIREKTRLINQKLDNYDKITTNYLYYTSDVQTYLNLNQNDMTPDKLEDWKRTITSYTNSLLTDNNPEIEKVKLFNKYGNLYINSTIYANTLELTRKHAKSIHEIAQNCHGKIVIKKNPEQSQMLTIARTVHIPTLDASNEEIGFLLLDISKSALKKQLAIQENEDAMYILLVDDEGEILVNASSRTDEECLRILSRNKDNSYIINRKNLAYGGCQIISILNQSVLFADVYKLFKLEVGIMIISVLIILGAIIYSGNIISGQVSRFINKLNQTQEINQNAYMRVDSKDEFQDLAKVYNNMLARIDKLIHTVYIKELLIKDAQLESLQAQINPHFLYNTLDCVNSLVDMGEKESVKKVVTSLASIMRMSIKGNTFISVREDISYIEQYVFIQRMRFQNKILFLIEVPESMYLYYIPKLTIQPLVENAVLHGVANLKETGMIGIFGSEDENNIYISIKDNGFGMPEEIIKAFDKLEDFKGNNKSHIGIFNIQKKLQILYGSDYGLTIEPVRPHGTCVTICIPKSLEPYKKGEIDENFDCRR